MRARIMKVAALLAVPAMLAWTQVNTPLRLQPASKLWVNGTSTVKSFECQAKTFSVVAESAVPDAIAAVLAGERGVGAVELKVPVTELDCRNGTMNEHMLKALKSVEHKDVVFTLNSYDLAKASEGARVTLRGTLGLGGVKKEILIDADVKAGPDGALIVAGKHALKMTEYGLKPPKLMLGTLKVNELVNVNFELLLKP
jgi:polyisoprenoid-binding protein YceI